MMEGEKHAKYESQPEGEMQQSEFISKLAREVRNKCETVPGSTTDTGKQRDITRLLLMSSSVPTAELSTMTDQVMDEVGQQALEKFRTTAAAHTDSRGNWLDAWQQKHDK